jgi:hypothetical protein
MPALRNPKHEAFCLNLMLGLTLALAYEKAGYKPSAPNACVLKKKQHISERLAELVRERSTKSVEKVSNGPRDNLLSMLAELAENREIARSLGDVKAMNQASLYRSQLLGLVVNKSETRSTSDVAMLSTQQQNDLIISLLTSGRVSQADLEALGRGEALPVLIEAKPN